MIVVIPTPRKNCPALNALTMEDVQPLHLAICQRPNDYGRLLAEYWDRGQTFAVCEWDICPPPGAVASYEECGSPWCLSPYPLHRGNVAQGFGFSKYVPEGPAPAEWKTTEWRMLDGAVIPHLRTLYGQPHVHPPVAHAREEVSP